MSRLYIVSCTHDDTDKRRRFAVVADTGQAALLRVVDTIPDGPRHHEWRVVASEDYDVLEIGMGGDVPVGGLS